MPQNKYGDCCFPLNSKRLFPRILFAGFALVITATVQAQQNEPDGRTRYANSATKSLEAEPAIVRSKDGEERPPINSFADSSLARRFHDQLLPAIEAHLGASYHYNTTGPNTFDCSGFVWRTFQEAGVNFTRGPARSYWATFVAPTKEDEFTFGTLVFFGGLKHVGIVADEHGFYHSSRHHGVIYSPFNDYWLSRIDGFRRVPLNGMQMVAIKSASPSQSSEDGTPP